MRFSVLGGAVLVCVAFLSGDVFAEILVHEDFEDTPKTVGWMEAGGWFGISQFGPGTGGELTSEVKCPSGKRCLKLILKTGQKSAASMFHQIKPSETVHIRYYRMFPQGWVWPDGYGPHDSVLYGGKWESPTGNELSVFMDLWKTADTITRVGSGLRPGQQAKLLDYQKKTSSVASGWGRAAIGLYWNKSEPDKFLPGKWNCLELGVKLSTPGKADGEVRLWVNGKLCSEWTDIPLRDTDQVDLKFHLFFLSMYFHPGSPKDQFHYVDDIVISTEYIGPVGYKKPAAKP